MENVILKCIIVPSSYSENLVKKTWNINSDQRN